MKQFIPPEVIQRLVKYADKGVHLETRIEDQWSGSKKNEGKYLGELRRWYITTVDGITRTCIWSEKYE